MGDAQGGARGVPLLPALWLGVTRAARTAPTTTPARSPLPQCYPPVPAAPYLCPQPPRPAGPRTRCRHRIRPQSPVGTRGAPCRRELLGGREKDGARGATQALTANNGPVAPAPHLGVLKVRGFRTRIRSPHPPGGGGADPWAGIICK